MVAKPRVLRNKCQKWPTVNNQPANHERYVIILLENIKVVILIIQSLFNNEKEAGPQRTLNALIINAKNFIKKIIKFQDLNIRQLLKLIKTKLNTQLNKDLLMLLQKIYAQIAAHATRQQNVALGAVIA